MKQFLTGAGRAEGPDHLGSPWKWLIAGALAFGVAPVSVQAQDTGYGETGSGDPGTSQTARLAPATLFGLPADKGRVKWPFGLLVLQPADEAKALREQLELVLYFAATQAAEGKANRVFIDLGLQAVRDLRQLLRQHEVTIP